MAKKPSMQTIPQPTSPDPKVPKPSWRKPAGILALLLYLVVYAGLATRLADMLGSLPTVLMALGYMLLGIAWVPPLRPLFLWMNTGRWRRG